MRTAAEYAHWRQRVEAAVMRCLDRQRQRATLTAAATRPPVPPFDPTTWDDDIEDELRPEADAAVGHAVTTAVGLLPAALAGISLTLGLGDGWADRIVAAGLGLGAGLQERLAAVSPLDPDYDAKLSDLYDGAAGQAANIGSIATHAGNAVANDAATAAADVGFTLTKTWVTVGDEKVREAHADLEGETVDAAEPFIDLDGNELMFPGDPTADPETVFGCRCWLVFAGYGEEGAVPEDQLPGEAMGEAAE